MDVLFQFSLDALFDSDEDDADAELPCRVHGPRYDRMRSVIATHGINRDLYHECSLPRNSRP
jgi:hypothetical protein